MTTEEIRALPKIVRLAGYLARMAALDEVGAKLRSNKEDEAWSPEEEKEWDDQCDLCDPWFWALSDKEHDLLKPIINWMACLCRGEDPEEHIELSYKLKGKYVASKHPE